jgi:hypothetical protein
MDDDSKLISPSIRSYNGDPLIVFLLEKLKIRAYQMSLLVFLSGFGILSVWYWIMVYAKDADVKFRGLYAHYSSSYGDALVVPIIVGIIFLVYLNLNKLFNTASRAVHNKINLIFSNKLWLYLTLLSALMATLLFHVFAVYGPERNWTLPEYGVLNAPGWYHGLFMFFLLYIIFGFTIRFGVTIWVLFFNWRKLGDIRKTWKKITQYMLCYFLLLGVFSGLLSADRLKPDATVYSILSIVVKETSILGVYVLGISLYLFSIFLEHKFRQTLNLYSIVATLLLIFIVPLVPIFMVYLLR